MPHLRLPSKAHDGSAVEIESARLLLPVLCWLTAKWGSKSTRSLSAKPEISRARGRWSTTAWRGTPLPRPLVPLPLALRAPRPRGWTPRPRPVARTPLLAAWEKNQNQDRNINNSQRVQISGWCLLDIRAAEINLLAGLCVRSIKTIKFKTRFSLFAITSICSWVYLIFNIAVSSPAWVFLYRSSSASSSSFCAWTENELTSWKRPLVSSFYIKLLYRCGTIRWS